MGPRVVNSYDAIPIVRGVRRVKLNSWREFYSLIEQPHPLHNDTFIYRGQGDADWLIQSTIDRLEDRFPTKRNRSASSPTNFGCPPVNRHAHLRAFKIATRGVGTAFERFTEREWWTMAQHHGLATPIVDWTVSPFVALFFAFEHPTLATGKRLGPPATRAVYCALAHLVGANATKSCPAPIVFQPLRALTVRLNTQGSVLMEMPPHWDLESSVRKRFRKEESSKNAHANAILTKFVIPNEGREDCLKMLNRMNINRMSLFGDVDGAAAYINSLWEQDFDTPIGWLPDAADVGSVVQQPRKRRVARRKRGD